MLSGADLVPANAHDTVIMPFPMLHQAGVHEDCVRPAGAGGGGELYLLASGAPSFALLSALRLASVPPHERAMLSGLAVTGERLSQQVSALLLLRRC